MAGPAEPHLLAEAIDWSGVSDGMKEKILSQWWEPFPAAMTREHEVNKLVEAAGGWDNKEAVEKLKDSFLDQTAALDYESQKAAMQRGGSIVQGEWVQEWDGGYKVYSCRTQEGIRQEYHERYGDRGIHYAYEMLDHSRRHHAKMVEPEPERYDPARYARSSPSKDDDRGMSR